MQILKKSPLEEIESLVSTRTTARLISTTAKLDDDETRAPESTAWTGSRSGASDGDGDTDATEEAWSRLGGDGDAVTA